jgi:hypothetical protein
LINHYVNLVGWKVLLNNYDSSLDIYNCDSISLLLMARIFGWNPAFTPGSTIIPYAFTKANSSGTLFLVSNFKHKSYFKYSYLLPQFESEVFVDETLAGIISNNSFNEIFIGISSPKQNVLAHRINSISPDLTIYCIGAALNVEMMGSKKSILSRTGFQWIDFLFRSPKRTFFKLYDTVLSVLLILFNKDERLRFKLFCARLQL